MSCLTCGGCCTSGQAIEVTPQEAERIPASMLRSWWGAIIMKWRRVDGRQHCIAFDKRTGKCRIYEHRPAVCRDFQPDSEGCKLFRRQIG